MKGTFTNDYQASVGASLFIKTVETEWEPVELQVLSCFDFLLNRYGIQLGKRDFKVLEQAFIEEQMHVY